MSWAKCVNSRYNGKRVQLFQHVVTPFYMADIYDTYMDGCIVMSEIYICNPNVIIFVIT